MSDYVTIRSAELFGPLIGKRVVDVTQQDEEQWLCGDPAFFCIHFDDGRMLRVVVDGDPTRIILLRT